MSAWTEAQTMRMAYAEIVQGERPWVALGDFSNYFFRGDKACKETLLSDPIDVPENIPFDQEVYRWAVFCAASVEYLCHKYHLTVPSWVRLYAPLGTPWFHHHAESKPVMLERYLRTTPEAFTKRNIYCGDRIWLDKHEEAAKLQQRLLSA